MTLSRLVLASAAHHWRTNLAVCFGVAASVAVLGGALLTGDSVRGSLRDLALSRLGHTGYSVSSPGFFRDGLAADLSRHAGATAAPLIAIAGFVTHEPSGRRAAGVLVYGVDDRFWQFHEQPPRGGVLVSPALAAELNVAEGDTLLTRLQRPSDIPLESLFAQKEDIARTVRLPVAGVLPRDQLGEFSLQPQQAEVRAIFAPLARLQRDLAVPGQVNTVLLAGGAAEDAARRAFRAAVTLDDLGVKVEAAADRSTLIVESAGGVLSESLEQAVRDTAAKLGLTATPVFTYLANTIRVGDREVPYSLVTGLDIRALPSMGRGGSVPGGAPNLGAPLAGPRSIVLNEWTARELGAAVGDPAELEYYLWDPAAGLRTDRTPFTVAGIVPMTGLTGDRRLAPEYPGITGSESLADWDPPFPLDLSRVRPQDEKYWDDHRSTPKAFVPYTTARELWSTRYGRVTSLRLTVPAGQDAAGAAESLGAGLQRTVSPESQGLALVPSRRLAMASAAGATNFGEYFTYFSFFIVVSAVLLAVLFFRLGVEQRLRQIGILRASGYTVAHIRRMFSAEAALLALAGGLMGTAGAIGYAHAIVYGLRTWWVGAVGTTLLEVHLSPVSLLAGFVGGLAAAVGCVLLSLRAVARRSPRALLGAYSLEQPSELEPHRVRRSARFSTITAVAGLALLTLGFVAPTMRAASFFGAGAMLLAAFLFALSSWLRSRHAWVVAGHGGWAVARLGFRSAAFRPGRSVLSTALIASAVFIIVSVEAFRRHGGEASGDPRSGTGGYALLARAEVPLVHNPNEPAGREALMVRAPELETARFSRFRLRPGEDASCLNLYRPANPTIIAPDAAFVAARRFAFAGSLAESEEERANPWLLLRRRFDDGSVPAIADATSMQYVLHVGLGDTMSIDIGGRAPLVLRFVGALRDSVLQGELIVGEEQFLALFPGHEGFRFFLIDAPGVTTSAQAAALAQVVEQELQPFGVDAVSTLDRLDAFHRVENTYLSTFQALGGLGLLLGTVGLATVMFRSVLERRRELALLRAVGYNARHVTIMIGAETLFLLACGLAAGIACALVAIAPAWIERGGAPGAGLVLLLGGVIAAGILSALAATRAALSGRLLAALRVE